MPHNVIQLHCALCQTEISRVTITLLQERVFEGCGGIEDLPPKSIRRVNQSSSNINFAELPAVLGKRQHQATTIQQDNTVIVIDDDDEEVVEFVTKKPRVGNYGSTRSEGTQNPSPSISKAHIIHHAMLQC